MQKTMIERICTFTGHRSKFFPWGDDLTDKRAMLLLNELKGEVMLAANEGFNTFLCGGAQGVDTWVANIILDLKEKYPYIKLIIVLPFEGYNSFITEINYSRTIKYADEIIVVGAEKGVKGFTKRDHYMIDRSERVIAVYDERSKIKSGTYRAVQYAKEKRKDIRFILWMDYLSEQ